MTTETARRGRPNTGRRSPNRLREFRLAAQMTQVQLAEYLGVAQPIISKAEIDGTGLGSHKWFQLSDLFDVDPRILRGWKPRADDDPKPTS